MPFVLLVVLFFFFNDTATTEIYTLSLHDALPILGGRADLMAAASRTWISSTLATESVSLAAAKAVLDLMERENVRSEEHTSELQSQSNLVCRLLLETKKY